jgi:hypothetical protein
MLVKSKLTKKGNLRVTFTPKEVELLEGLIGQFTYDTILKIFQDGDYPDAMKEFEKEYEYETFPLDKTML